MLDVIGPPNDAAGRVRDIAELRVKIERFRQQGGDLQPEDCRRYDRLVRDAYRGVSALHFEVGSPPLMPPFLEIETDRAKVRGVLMAIEAIYWADR